MANWPRKWERGQSEFVTDNQERAWAHPVPNWIVEVKALSKGCG